MGTYVVLSRVNAEGLRTIKKNPDRFDEIRREVEAMDGKIVSQFALLGEYDFLTVVSAPDNHIAHQMAVERTSQGRSRLTVMPAIDLPLFVRLLGQTTETTGPYRWQIRFPAQVVRRALRWYTVTRHVRTACKPLTFDGQDNFKALKGPAIFIANHSSHLDSIVLLQALPERYRRRLAFGGAADRWFLKGMKGIQKQGWWNSLAMNSFPIKRGGGSSSLDYAKWLIDKKWSIMIFPEGTRSSTGKMGHFRHGVSILALEKNVPVVPIYMDGLRNIRPKGSKTINPGPVHVKIGQPIRFEPGTAVPEATRMLYHAMEGLRKEVRRPRASAQEVASGSVEAPAEAGG